MKPFDILVVMSITTGRLLTPIDNVYKILNFILGENLMTHELPTAWRIANEFLLAQHPELKYITVPEFEPHRYYEVVDAYAKLFPNQFFIKSINEFNGIN